MTITLTLTPEEEAQLRQKAALSGQTPEQVLLAPLQVEDAPTLDPVLAEIIAEAECTQFVPGVRPPGQEAEIAKLVAAKFRKHGLNV